MAVRGKYSAEEEKMLADWNSKTEVGAAWLGEEISPSLSYPVYHRTATTALIENMANGMGDKNPLFRDEKYARNTRWGKIIAPPLFPHIICMYGKELQLRVPPEIGKSVFAPGGVSYEFFKPISAGDTFRVRECSPSIEDVTDLDGNKPRTFLIITSRKYINQNDEVACTICTKRTTMIIPPGENVSRQPVLPLLKMSPYKYSQEELDFIDSVADAEKIRGADTLYWEDINTGDELQQVAVGPITIWDQIMEISGRGALISTMREMREKRPRGVTIDPETNVPHHTIELHLVDRTAQLFGGTTSVVSRPMIDDALCRLMTNWMGDDGFLRKLDIQNCAVVPTGDSFFCRGKVVNKRTENGEHLVDLVIWAETIRGYITAWATASVSLLSKQDE